MEIYHEKFGTSKDGKEVFKYTLKNEYLEIEVINFGGVIKKIMAPDRHGRMENVVLGMDTLKDYEERSPHFGALIGRTAGRLAKGEITIEGNIYPLDKNSNGVNSIHGGKKGFSERVWDSKEIKGEDYVGVELTLVSPHMEEGYPGNVNVTVTYKLIKDQLVLEYYATSDRPTFINMTNHSYFNISGNCKRTIMDELLKINASYFTTVDKNTLPIEVKETVGTSFDFHNFKHINKAINSHDEQIEIVNGGIDHCFVLDKGEKVAAILKDALSSRVLEVITDQKGLVVYTGNYLDKIGKIADGVTAKKHLSICFETQNFPDTFRSFPKDVVLCDKNKPYKQKTTYRFYVEK